MALWVAQTAFAAEPIRALIVDGQNNHDWKRTTPVLKKILEETNFRHPAVKENKLAYLGRIFNAAIFRFRLGSIEIPHFAKISGRHQDV